MHTLIIDGVETPYVTSGIPAPTDPAEIAAWYRAASDEAAMLDDDDNSPSARATRRELTAARDAWLAAGQPRRPSRFGRRTPIAAPAAEPATQPAAEQEAPSAEPGAATTRPADIIATLRAAGRTVRQIARLVGVSVSTIYRWARGVCAPRPANAAALAAATGA